MFICNKKDKEIKFFDGKSLKEIMWDFDSIFSVIKKKYNKIDNFYIWYYWNSNPSYKKNLLVFVPRFWKLFEFDSNFAKEIWIKTLLSYLNTYTWTDLNHWNNIINCEIYGSLIKKRHIKICNYQNFIKSTFMCSIAKDNLEYISYSHAPLFRWKYRRKSYVENTWVWVDINKNIAIQKSLSENIERASASEFLYEDKNFKYKKLISLTKYNQKIINLYRNECSIPDIIRWVTLKWLTTNKTIFLPDFLVFYPTQKKHQYNTCSSGMATHLTLEKAILWWIFELIERDSFVYSRLSCSKKIYRINESFIKDIWISLKSDYHFSFFLLDSIVPVCTVLAIMDKWGKKCISLWTDFLLENAIKKAYQEGINSKPFFKNKNKSDDNSEIMQHIYYYLNPENWNKLEWLNSSPTLELNCINQEILNYQSLILWCKNHNINFFFYEFMNSLNNIFGRKTVRVFSPDLLPIYFWKRIPDFILKNERIEKLTYINTDLHPLG
jgi:hypothetical protein